MRKLMWFAIGFAAACGLRIYALPEAWSVAALVFFGIAGCLFAVLGSVSVSGRKAALVCFGCLVGLSWYARFRTERLAPLEAMDGRTQTVTIRTVDYSKETGRGIRVEGLLIRESGNARVSVYLDAREPLTPGCLLTGSFRLSFTAPKEDPVSWLSGEGIFLIARQEDALEMSRDERVLWQDRIAAWRKWLSVAMEQSFTADTLPFARALLLGDTSLLDYETDTDFKVSGIRHVVAVSGLHVSILVALLSAVTFRKRFLTVPVGLGLLLVFAALAGFTPSVSRACIMAGLMLLALLFDREYDGPTALSFAVLVMLLGNPLAAASVSLQLSVASVVGIYCFRQGIADWLLSLYPHPGGKGMLPSVTHWLDVSVSVSLSAMVFTTPLCAWYFGMVSLVGVLTNLLVLWVISLIFYGIMAVCLVYALFPWAAAVLARAVGWPIRYVLTVAGLLADFPLAAVYTSSEYIVLWLIFVYVLLAVFYLSQTRQPAVLLCCAVLGLSLALMTSWLDGRNTNTQITVLDVGQGQCILLQTDGGTWMVDCGGDTPGAAADRAASFLLGRGIPKLDGMILTHLDDDHAAGAELLLSRMDTDLLILPPEATGLDSLTEGTVLYGREDLEITWGDAVLTVFAAGYPGTSNEKSLCVLLETEKCAILITGDRDGFGERMLLRQRTFPQVDVLLAGHHGSRHSTCEELLAAVSPQIVCISVGADNPFGHPAPELLARLEKYGCAVYRTDRNGTITIRR